MIYCESVRMIRYRSLYLIPALSLTTILVSVSLGRQWQCSVASTCHLVTSVSTQPPSCGFPLNCSPRMVGRKDCTVEPRQDTELQTERTLYLGTSRVCTPLPPVSKHSPAPSLKMQTNIREVFTVLDQGPYSVMIDFMSTYCGSMSV